ncbi:hypothetical protein Bbelb_285210 [Branchiostoma belcheri]|nr:hypothetical protein Bbelb_285210 [Branchiostoma belcheri]
MPPRKLYHSPPHRLILGLAWYPVLRDWGWWGVQAGCVFGGSNSFPRPVQQTVPNSFGLKSRVNGPRTCPSNGNLKSLGLERLEVALTETSSLRKDKKTNYLLIALLRGSNQRPPAAHTSPRRDPWLANSREKVGKESPENQVGRNGDSEAQGGSDKRQLGSLRDKGSRHKGLRFGTKSLDVASTGNDAGHNGF